MCVRPTDEAPQAASPSVRRSIERRASHRCRRRDAKNWHLSAGAQPGNHLVDVEVLSALRRLVASGEAPAERAGEAISDLHDLPIERYPHDILVPRIWELRENFSAYDASYVALAEAVADDPVPLLTADGRLGRAVGAHTEVPVLLAA